MTLNGILACISLLSSIIILFDIIHWIDEGYSFIYRILIKGGFSEIEWEKHKEKESRKRKRGEIFENAKARRGAIFVTIMSLLMIIIILKIAHLI